MAEERKLPFKTYTVMNNVLIQRLGCSDVYRAYVLSLTTDKVSLETDTTIKQLAEFVGEPPCNYIGGSSNKSFNDKLRDTFAVELIPFSSNGKNRILYRFYQPEKGHYRRIGRAFYDKYNHITHKEWLGFLLKLFSITDPHSMTISKSISQIAKVIHMGRDTIKRYIKAVNDYNICHIEETKSGLILHVHGFIIDNPYELAIKKRIEQLDKLIEAIKEKSTKKIPAPLIEYQKYRNRNFEGIRNMSAWLDMIEQGFTRRTKGESLEDTSLYEPIEL